MTRLQKLPVGSTVGSTLTILGAVDDDSPDPVYIVWNHQSWCPMACKFFASAARARREADIMSRLSHPNIIRLMGVGDAPAHILMEFLEGPTLADELAALPKSHLTISDAVRVAIYIGSALVHMHSRGVLHLDVKPANVIIAAGRPILFDFGTARTKDDWGRACIEGSDEYMAPEQCVRRMAVTPATDVFGLGATLYELLTGKLPFPRRTKQTPFSQVTRDARPLRHYRSKVPVALESLVMSCLARDAAQRPSSPQALLARLHDFISSGARMWPHGFEPRGSSMTANAGRGC